MDIPVHTQSLQINGECQKKCFNTQMQQNLTLLTPVSAFALKYFIKDALQN